MNKDSFVYKSFDYAGSGFELLEALKNQPHVVFLQSSQHDPNRGRFTFLGCDPYAVYEQKGETSLDGLREQFNRYSHLAGNNPSLPETPFPYGIAGCLSYDYGLQQEHIAIAPKDDLGLPDCFFGFYDCIITIDHFNNKLHITSSGLPETDKALRQRRAEDRLNWIMERIIPALCSENTTDQNNIPSVTSSNLSSNMTRKEYVNAVNTALHHIAEGNIYQVNLSQCFELPCSGDFDPTSFYGVLSRYAPAPFGGYIDCGTFRLVSNSPERFLSLNGDVVQTRPMKGTRPRGHNEEEDLHYRRELLESEKEKAELLMITDLQRNDLGRVCQYGTIAVTEPRTLEEYNYVHQATSNVQGVLREDKDCFDLIEACFPGGSITGCPKIRAMNIINELEPTRRGMYTGTMGYISFTGNMDLNILIRTLIEKDRTLYFQVGGGIVADSDPEEEYMETLTKAGALHACLSAGMAGANEKVTAT